MVGVARIELATPAMSTQCSTTELHAHATGYLVSAPARRNPARGRNRLEPAVLILGLEHPVHLGDQVLEVEGL